MQLCSKERVTSFQEKIVFYYVKKYFPSTIDNYKIKELGKREIDIFVPNINVGIEYDGGYYQIDPNHRSRGQGCPQCYKEKTKNEQ